MIVIVPVRLAGRRTVRTVNSEYFSKIWSTGALKNFRKCSARSACPSAAALVDAVDGVGGAAGLPGVGAAARPATLASGLTLGAAFVAGPGRGSAGTATRFVFRRMGRFVIPSSPLRCASETPGRAGRRLEAAAAAGGLVTPGGELVAVAV